MTIAISQTADPTGSWFVYFFSTGTTFPDYPKFSVWNDAYYGTTNDFANGSTYSGSSAYAFDRTKMIAGNQSKFNELMNFIKTQGTIPKERSVEGMIIRTIGFKDSDKKSGYSVSLCNELLFRIICS